MFASLARIPDTPGTFGLIFWGGIGYGLDKWLDKGIFTLIGMLVGISGAIYLVWLRFGRE